MPEFTRPPQDDPSLDAVRRSDDFIEALATGRPAAPQDSADAALAALLGNWRDEMRRPPATGLITEPQALAALEAGRAEKRPRREQNWTAGATPKRSRRGLSVVGAAAAAVLCIGGFGAVVAGAGPGDALYGLRTMMFGAPKQVRDDQVALAARTELQQVQEMISRGDWQQAQEKLVAVSTQVASVGDEQQKQELLTQFNDLSAKVVERDPAATAPPGIVYTVPPEATDLVPVVVPLTTDSSTAPSRSDTTAPSGSDTTAPSGSDTTAPSGSDTTAPSGSESATTSTSAPSSASTSGSTSAPTSASTSAPSSASTSAPSSAATSSAPAAATSTAPSAATPTTTAAPASTSAAATTSSPAQQRATTTATSAAPVTSSAAPEETSTAATSEPRAAAATTTPTTPAAPQSTTTAEASQAPVAAEEATEAPTTEVPSAPEPVVTTTVEVPAG